ncbi:MAG: hypothetical protein AAAB36_27580, partial [Ensifer adhaerens]
LAIEIAAVLAGQGARPSQRCGRWAVFGRRLDAPDISKTKPTENIGGFVNALGATPMATLLYRS